jgi:ribosomal protein S27E
MIKKEVADFFKKAAKGTQPTEVECKECGHDWTPASNDTHPALCHVCGYDTQAEEYDIDSFMDFWANFNGQQ